MNVGIRLIGILRSLLLAVAVFLLWAWLRPDSWSEQVTLFLMSLVAFLVTGWTKGLRESSASKWLLSLDLRHPGSNPSAFQIEGHRQLDSVWIRNIEEDI